MTWKNAQKWETGWWGDCLNTYGEEEKQLLYASRMGLKTFHNGKSPYNINLAGARVVDIGGGPASLLLKCQQRASDCWVVDPILEHVPEWVLARYAAAGISPMGNRAEDLPKSTDYPFDEAWIYNCLQHTESPEQIIENALGISKIVRVFEWIETRINEGHPHSFTAERLDELLGGHGKVETLRGQANCFGKCYYGIFVGIQAEK